jgi:hypothetical protein
MPENDNKEARKVLLAQAKVLGMDVDGRWSVERLAEEVQSAQEAAAEAKKAEFAAAKKVPVLLKRAAWPQENERHEIGEVIEVPVEMAKRWISLGVAERADPLE